MGVGFLWPHCLLVLVFQWVDHFGLLSLRLVWVLVWLTRNQEVWNMSQRRQKQVLLWIMLIILDYFMSKQMSLSFYNTFLNQNTQNYHADLGQTVYCVGEQFFGLTHKKSRSVKYVPEEVEARSVVTYVNDIRLFHDKTKVIEILQHISQSKYTKFSYWSRSDNLLCGCTIFWFDS